MNATPVVGWRRRLPRSKAARRAVLALAVLVALRLMLWLATPLVLDSLARARGLSCEYDDLSLSLRLGCVELRGLRLRERGAPPDSTPLATLEHALVDLDWSATLTTRPRIERAEIDGLSLRYDVDANGRCAWDVALTSNDDAAEGGDEEPLSLAAPLDLHARLNRIALHASDARTSTVVDAVFDARADLAAGHGEFVAWLAADQLLTSARVEGTLDTSATRASAQARVQLDGLDLESLRGALAPFGIEPVGAPLSTSLRVSGSLDVVDAAARTLSARASIDAARIEQGGSVALDLGGAVLEAPELRVDSLRVASFEVRAPQLRVGRRADGRIEFAGLAFGPASGSGRDDAPPSVKPSPRLSLDHVALIGGRVVFRDESVAPPVEFRLEDGRVTVDGLTWNGAAASPAQFSLGARLPALADEIALDGQIVAAPQRIELTAWLRADGVTLEAARPHLAALGLEPALTAGAARARIAAQVELVGAPAFSATIDGVDLSDGARLFALDHFALRNVQPGATALRIEAAELSGLKLAVRRASNGSLHVMGLRLVDAPRANDGDSQPSKPTSTTAAPQAFALGELRVEQVGLEFLDEALEAAQTWSVLDAGCNATELVFGAAAGERKGELHAWLRVDDVLERATFDGRVEPFGDGARLVADIELAELNLQPLAPYCAPLGIEPTLQHGLASAHLDVALRPESGGWRGDLQVQEVALVQGDQTLASLARFAVDGFALNADATRVTFARVDVDRPALSLRRDADGVLEFCGVRLVPTQGPLGGAEPAPPSEDSTTPRGAFSARGESLSLANARLEWSDATTTPEFASALEGALEVGPLEIGTDAPPSVFDVRASLGGAVETARLQLEATLDPARLRAKGDVSLAGVHPEALAAYFPAGWSSTVRNGGVHVAFEAALDTLEGSAFALRAELRDAAWTDGELELARVDSVSIEAPRCAPNESSFEVGSLAIRGVRASAERLDPTRVAALGFVLESAQAEDTSTTNQPRTTDKNAIPRVAVGAVELELVQFEWRDHTAGADSAALEFAARLSHRGPAVWLSPEPTEISPIEFAIDGSLAPVLAGFETRWTLAAFADEPSATCELQLHGLRGAGLTELRPELAATLDGSGLAGGEARATLRAFADVRRRSALELDLDAPLTFDVALENVEFTSTPAGASEVGLQALRVEGAQLDARTGALRIPRIEIETPKLRARRSADGLHVLGLVLRPATESADAAVAAPNAPPAEEELPEFVIERCVVHGIDVEFVDSTGAVEARAPLHELDAELTRLSLRGLARGEPLAFRLTLGASEVELPPRIVADSLLEGIALGVGDLFDGEDGATAPTSRPLFALVDAQGKFSPWPEPRGWASFDVEALELPAFRGPAEAAGLTIGDGLFDLGVRLRFHGAAGTSVEAASTFTHLSLSEPADGPLSRYLSLPAPLDSVLFLLKDAEGRHKVSLGFRATQEGVSTGAIVAAVAGAAAETIARAIASSPLRLLSTLTDVVGVTGDEGAPPPAQSRAIAFAACDVRSPEDTAETLAPLARKLRSDSKKIAVLIHELSRADLERAARLANPSLDDCELLTARLRQRKAELMRAREEFATRARTDFALGDSALALAACARVRELDIEIGQNEDALERLFDLSRPGAERRAAGRTKSAALALGGERVARIRQALHALGVADQQVTTRAIRVQVAPELEAGGRVLVGVR